MKFFVIFAAVLLAVNAAKVPLVPEVENEHDVQVPVEPNEVVATVLEVSKDHIVSTEVTPIVSTMVDAVTDKVEVQVQDVGVQVDVVKVPLTQNPQVVPVTVLTQVSEISDNVKKSVDETPMLVEEVPADPMVTTVRTPVDNTEITTVIAEDETTISVDSSRCDLLCTKLDLNPICAVNFDCIHEFPNNCVMETYNCLHPNKAFKEVKDERCKMHWLKKCTEKEMMED